MEFKNREGNNLNRRKIKIVSQSGDEIIADIERADNNIIEPGTRISADILQDWNNVVNVSNLKSTDALSRSNQAISTSNTALSKSNIADSKANQAIDDALSALTNSQEALNTIAQGMGTVISVNNDAKANIEFNSDPQSQINDLKNNKLNINSQSVDSAKLGGKLESQLNVDSASKLGGKSESQLSVNNSLKLNNKLESELNVLEASRTDKLLGKDTRDVNGSPSSYFSRSIGFISEFKRSNIIGLPAGSPSYCLLLTNVPWKDVTGGLPSQVAYLPNGEIKTRSALSETQWGSWSTLAAWDSSGKLKGSSLELSGAFSALNNNFSFSDPVNVGIEMGRRDGTPGTPYIDFHTDGKASTDYNSRIIAVGNDIRIQSGSGSGELQVRAINLMV